MKVNIFGIQVYDSIMCGYFHVGLDYCMLKIKFWQILLNLKSTRIFLKEVTMSCKKYLLSNERMRKYHFIGIWN